ncbi:MAG: pseudouridine synthase [Flavobacteriales bacterium]|nr:pseudouridine synthase [Flavobacteriales bacterium]
METKRLNKAISETGYCSRRGADKLIEAGEVKVNGQLPELGTKVTAADVISIDGKIITKEVENIYLAFNKPVGVTCTTERHIEGNIIDYINYPERIFPIGRLDKPSEGLIFMTNDGDIVNKILRSKNSHQKEYLVTVSRRITDNFIYNMSNGVPILDTVTEKCVVKRINDTTFNIILTQGLNRQIRRMCDYLGYQVNTLQRVRIMNISLDGIKKGEYRSFTEKELSEINELIKDSSKTF